MVCMLAFVWANSDRFSETGTILSLYDLSYMWEMHRIIALLWTGVVTTVVAIIMQGIALQKASATDAALIFSTEPVWGSLFAGWLLNEELSSTTYIGGAFILIACVLGSLGDGGGHGGGNSVDPNAKAKATGLASPSSSSSWTGLFGATSLSQRKSREQRRRLLKSKTSQDPLKVFKQKHNGYFGTSAAVKIGHTDSFENEQEKLSHSISHPHVHNV
eukprot:CAMPEP_0198130140 /NCGR_PEP_ID=MMETSP1442-20131203/53256_1 /TAXON_ID= /ORGANISM="Craspedostauros australis, Strain CCMP3328" /LENGTH=216 /DNA_ID=CAMNT_0043790687 /DNA_START=13 /DNA_END=663 /DNA_ORIENTATION=+